MKDNEQFLNIRHTQMEHALSQQLKLQEHDYPYKRVGNTRFRTDKLIDGLNRALMGMCSDLSTNAKLNPDL